MIYTKKKQAILLVCAAISLTTFGNEKPVQAGDSEPFPYQLQTAKDIVLTTTAATLFTTGTIMGYYVEEASENHIAGLNADDVNKFDRSATNRWSPASSIWSDITVSTVGLLPFGVVLAEFAKKQRIPALTISLMYAQAMGISVGLTSVVKATFQRTRPFLYNESISQEDKLDQTGTQKSFYSGHTSMAFCSAVFLAKTFNDINPNSNWRYAIWPLSLTLATTTGLLRYAAGKHFPTDILVGAAAGALIGWMIPALHKSKNKNKLTVYPIRNEFTGLGAMMMF